MTKKYKYHFKNWFKSGFFQLCLMVIILGSCKNSDNAQNEPKTFFDLKGFIENQITSLNNQKPTVSKTMEIGKEVNRISSNKIDWKKELELFIQADINKSAYKNSYSITHLDSLTYQYTIKKGEVLPVRLLRIKFNKPDGAPVRITALLQSENKLYKSEKNIDLTCIANNNGSMITSYHIYGFQKLATMEKKLFDVEAKINY